MPEYAHILANNSYNYFNLNYYNIHDANLADDVCTSAEVKSSSHLRTNQSCTALGTNCAARYNLSPPTDGSVHV